MKHKIILVSILVSAFFLRVYRTQDFLGFWYDQGRDAKVVWDLIHKQKLFLVGPTTGIEGIFLGPFYYYLITPAYLLGQGNPAFPSVFLAGLNVLAIYLLYRIGSEFFSQPTGLLAAAIVSFSSELIRYHRWLSNPTPLPLFALITFWSILKIISSSPRKRYWLFLGLGIGLTLQLEAASAIFFIPSTLIILFLNRKSLILNRNNFIFSSLPFVSTLVPQILFNFRHQNILLNSFMKFLIGDRSFQPAVTDFFTTRLALYYQFFTSKLFTLPWAMLLFVVLSLALFLLVRHHISSKPIVSTFIWWLTPVVILLFYHGNKGYVWDYYFTGVYPVFILLIASIWTYAFYHFPKSRLVVIFLVSLFLFQNLKNNYLFYTQALPGYISLTPQLLAIDWVYVDAAGQAFNTDVYVPPIIPLAYDYLFLWLGSTKYGYQPSTPLQTRLYTIQEPDWEHPTLLNNWLIRQTYYSSLETTKSFGPLTVQRRYRHKFN
ncbi:hypothetical protein A2634_05055 [Candidatus Amesbacteria bacterium RIFCSPHIGHO2_01_FULL_48_32]|uniref:Glycosyltransferase RgtA/B/C/D-like domain-containing protein n=1 Tax=Candidatus Amesbacteria bacterium RIFCSPLOWO2_01_FULL_48_25 TaxID=1797259 RepID=A0A1F4ZDI2_9BACT|nr:MAG: hypothetical protein A2634_05055 [Candidatus Amesbacteria bacterium RIFCSPHIGHO2_01_FULL_48_32]OGD04036.1 MAG: hypothetical protein A2989_01400 [Candidatus Amesbacteria bacterium RIFCSPLOWO2_01_FULL_48_25]HJZ05700.1 glycosyltransferase family 39 protein [Patescibacteria group bacterium]